MVQSGDHFLTNQLWLGLRVGGGSRFLEGECPEGTEMGVSGTRFNFCFLWNDFADFPGSLFLHLSSFLNLNHSTACWLRKNYFTLFLNNNHGLTNSLTDRVWCKKCRFLSWSLQFSGKDRLRKKKNPYTHTKLKQINKIITSCVKRGNRVLS